jgi:predicted Zn-dependent protease with MMP-like domain
MVAEKKDVDFDVMVTQGFEKLPQWVRETIKNVALLIENQPSREICISEGLKANETLLGLYRGIPLSARGDGYGVGMTLPDTITLFKQPILNTAKETGRPVQDIVTETVWHEFAHHFGMSEHEVRLRESERDWKPRA